MAWAPVFVNGAGTYTFGTNELVDEVAFECPSDIASEKVPRRHGVYVSEEPTVGARRITLQGRFQGTAAANRAALDSLLHVLEDSQGKLYLNGASGRYANAYKQDFSWHPVGGTGLGAILYTVVFFLADPFWYDNSLLSHAHVTTTNPETFTETNDGRQQQFPTITIAANQGGDVAGFTFTNTTTGETLTYAGTITSGTSLVIDTANFTVLNNGASDWANTTGALPNLKSGANSITFTGTVCTVTFGYRNRYNTPAFD